MSPNKSASTKSTGDEKRHLLLVYIHGFLGSERSFAQFPRHVHDLLTRALSGTHEVYTKIYPRYKTRGTTKIARDNFSKWLSCHESPKTDIILLGHSLGGLIAADTVLLRQEETAEFKHRVLGHVSFDVPYLGLHPRIVWTGISTLCRFPTSNNVNEQHLPPWEFETFKDDPKYNPLFSNDVNLKRRSGWDGPKHFLSKYSGQISRSILQYVYSYYDHAGCLHNYPKLLRRHKKIRQLAKGDLPRYSEYAQSQVKIVRFVNYYTACSGSRSPVALTLSHGTEIEVIGGISQPPASMISCTSPQNLIITTDEAMKGNCVDSVNIKTVRRKSSQSSSSAKPKEPDHVAKVRRKFCLLPGSGEDEFWVQLPIEAPNEILAHQSIFLSPGLHYSWLVKDTAARIQTWVEENLISNGSLI